MGPIDLDRIYTNLAKTNDVFEAMTDFDMELRRNRDRLHFGEWKSYCKEIIQPHPLSKLIHQAPFTRRAFEKPRGYPGDAVILDYIYRELEYDEETSALAKELYKWEMQTQSCRSVRARRDILRHYIDEAASLDKNAKILSIACGHLREAQYSKAIRDRRFDRFVALDQDSECLEIVAKNPDIVGVEAVAASVRSILKGEVMFQDMNLVYAAGLYDYLPLSVAKKLTKVLFGMLACAGHLLVANFSHSLENRGYLEALMDWWLIYRNDDEVRQFASLIEPTEVASVRTFLDPYGSIIFLDIKRGKKTIR